MNKLRSQHKRVIFAVFALSASLYFFLLINLPNSKAPLDLLAWFGVSWSVVAGLVILLYERWAWRIINPQFDFDGKWRFTEIQYRPNSGDYERVPVFHGKGSMRIVQDVRAIWITEGQTYRLAAMVSEKKDARTSKGTKTSDWWSESCELDDKASRIYCTLNHQSALDREGGTIGYAVEIYRVTERGKRGRPTKMASTVYHCIGFGTAHTVEVIYTRDRTG